MLKPHISNLPQKRLTSNGKKIACYKLYFIVDSEINNVTEYFCITFLKPSLFPFLIYPAAVTKYATTAYSSLVEFHLA